MGILLQHHNTRIFKLKTKEDPNQLFVLYCLDTVELSWNQSKANHDYIRVGVHLLYKTVVCKWRTDYQRKEVEILVSIPISCVNSVRYSKKWTDYNLKLYHTIPTFNDPVYEAF